jgi:hypothetical protein
VRENKLRIRPKASLCEVDEAEMTVLNLLLAAREEIVAAPATIQRRAHTLMALARAGKIKPTPMKSRWRMFRNGSMSCRLGKSLGGSY